MTTTPSLTRTQKQALAALTERGMLWPAYTGRMAGGNETPWSKRTLDGLVAAGVARWAERRHGVMPHIVPAAPEPTEDDAYEAEFDNRPERPGQDPAAPAVAKLLGQYDEWREDRADLSGQDNPASSDWHDSDDTGCDLADRLADALRDLTDALAKQAQAWHVASHDCDPGRESNDRIEDCEGTAMAAVYTDAARALEALIA